jgi:CubicO group peptidase (beta-lactamase class C family)
MLRASLLLVLLALFIGGLQTPVWAGPSSDGDPHAEIDSYINEKMEQLHIPGAALAIVQGDQVEYLQAYGVADRSGRAMTPQTPFMLASVSKSFTALAIMRLAEEGKLDIDAPVQKYLTWFRVADEQASAQITVRQLLYQTSGLTELDGNRFNQATSLDDDALIATMKRLNTVKLGHLPGESFEYSNLNYGLLGAIVETVSGQSFETYIQQNIFDPLGMAHSFTSLSEAQTGGMTSGYYPFLGIQVPYERFMPYGRTVTPWGGLFSSAEDLAHYLIAQLNDGMYGGKSVLSPAGITALHEPGIQTDKWYAYGMGWWIGPDFDLATRGATGFTIPVLFHHQGSWANYRTIAILEPQKKTGLVLLMNTNDPAIDSAYGMVGWDVLSIYSGIEPSNYPPYEDFIRQNSRLVFAGIILLLGASMFWFIRKLRGWGRQPSTAPRGRKLIWYLLIPLVLDAFITWFLLGMQIPQAKSTLSFVLRIAPDIGMLTLLVLLLAIVWGTIRTVWLLRMIFSLSRREKAVVDHPEGWLPGEA